MKERKHLSFDALISCIRGKFKQVTDLRQRTKVAYPMEDALMSAFGCFYFQEPSFLQFQKKMQDEASRSNLSSLLGVAKIPKESQLRDIIKTVNYQELDAIPKELILRLQRGKVLEKFSFLNNQYLLPLDATQFFSSDNISCSNCLTKNFKNGSINHSHQALQATIVHPNYNQVIPVLAEEISNTDGNTKQDCEQNAGKRLLDRIKRTFPKLGFIIGGDDLYSKEPFIRKVLDYGWSFIFTAKHSSHKTMKEYLDKNKKHMNNYIDIGNDSKRYIYEWMKNVPLTGNKDALRVNYFSLRIQNSKGVTTYFTSWVTNLPVSKSIIKKLVKAGRSRWKIENECFNNLKNRGYHLEHNFGHGEKLSFVLYLLLIFAFTVEQILAFTDLLYQKILKKYDQKKIVWGKITFFINAIYYESWRDLLQSILDGVRYKYVPI